MREESKSYLVSYQLPLETTIACLLISSLLLLFLLQIFENLSIKFAKHSICYLLMTDFCPAKVLQSFIDLIVADH